MKYSVFYMRPDWFRDGSLGGLIWNDPDQEKARKYLPHPARLRATHAFLTSVEADEGINGLEQIFHDMQGHIWSPNGEARSLIEARGLSHTSMSVGDAVVDETGKCYLVASFGFIQWNSDVARWEDLS
jgi:hypothetical protein